jgi:hypothetical protein
MIYLRAHNISVVINIERDPPLPERQILDLSSPGEHFGLFERSTIQACVTVMRCNTSKRTDVLLTNCRYIPCMRVSILTNI